MPSAASTFRMRSIFKKKKKKTQVLPTVEPGLNPKGEQDNTESELPQNELAPTEAQRKGTEPCSVDNETCSTREANPDLHQHPNTEAPVVIENPDGNLDTKASESLPRPTERIAEEEEVEDSKGWEGMFAACCNDDQVIVQDDLRNQRSSVKSNEELSIQLSLVEFLFFSDPSQASQRVEFATFAAMLEDVLALQEEDMLRLVYDFFQFVTKTTKETESFDLRAVTEALMNMPVDASLESYVYTDKEAFVTAHLPQLTTIQ